MRSYRYGFQGQEKDDEVKGEGNSINYKYRMHDPRIGRFFAVDPLAPKYAYYTPYQFSGNKVIHAIELEGLEEYELKNKVNKNGEVISSEFTYNPDAEILENDMHIYVFTTDSDGNETKTSMHASNATYNGGDIEPTEAPEHIFNTRYYYWWRNNDFKIRHSLMNTGLTPPEYYMNYGNKYVNRFLDETYDKLSIEGQGWLLGALHNLQDMIEDGLRNNPSIENNNNEFQNFAFDTHPEAYENAGLFDLHPADLYQIAKTPSTWDLLSPEGRKQMAIIAYDYHSYLVKSAAKTAKDAVPYKEERGYFQSIREQLSRGIIDFIPWHNY